MNDIHDLINFLTREQISRFIQQSANADINRLILNPPAFLKPYEKQVANQILARQKAKSKLPDWATNYELIMPPPLSIEQASSHQTANYKARLIEGNHLVDLTGGMGIDSMELHEKFERSTYVEQDKYLSILFNHNSNVLNKQFEVVAVDASQILSTIQDKAVFYIDPARRDDHENKVFKLEDCSPNLLDLIPQLRSKATTVLVKLSPFLDIKLVLKTLEAIKAVHVVSVKNDCKEILLILDFDFQNEPTIKTINLDTNESAYEFLYSEEEAAHAKIGVVRKFIFEPNASILKAGAFNKLSVDFLVDKIHPNTHLYTSDEALINWPGRTFEVVENQVNKRTLDQYAEGGLINVITRNYPLNPQQLKKKYKVKDGGDYFLIGFRDLIEKPQLLIASRIS